MSSVNSGGAPTGNVNSVPPWSLESRTVILADWPASAAGYRRRRVNSCHARAVNASAPASRSVVSRTRTTPSPLAVSMQDPPLPSEYVDFRQSISRLLPRSLAARYQRLNDEFLRRASIAWSQASQGGHER